MRHCALKMPWLALALAAGAAICIDVCDRLIADFEQAALAGFQHVYGLPRRWRSWVLHGSCTMHRHDPNCSPLFDLVPRCQVSRCHVSRFMSARLHPEVKGQGRTCFVPAP